MTKSESAIRKMLEKAGIEIGGNKPWDIHIHDNRVYGKIIRYGSLGLGESYMDSWWDCPAVDQFIDKIIRANLHSEFHFNIETIKIFVDALIQNRQSIGRSKKVAKDHYDISPELYVAMLGENEIYTCGYWKGLDRNNLENLQKAQDQKLDLIYKKLEAKPGMNVLDIGCGWGGTLRYGHEKYGIKGTGISISEEQINFANNVSKEKSLPLSYKLLDYRHLADTYKNSFDRIVSVGMFEHVGKKNYDNYMKSAYEVLKPNGLFLLHHIGALDSSSSEDAWLDKYIFHGSVLPSLSDTIKASEPYFIVHDVQNFGIYYDTTLMAWCKNFEQAWKNNESLRNQYNERFYRMWRYYLLMCAGSFRARKNQLYQFVFSKREYPGEYISPR